MSTYNKGNGKTGDDMLQHPVKFHQYWVLNGERAYSLTGQRKRKFACSATILVTRVLVFSNNLANARRSWTQWGFKCNQNVKIIHCFEYSITYYYYFQFQFVKNALKYSKKTKILGSLRKTGFLLNEWNAKESYSKGRSSYQIAGWNAWICKDFCLIIRRPNLGVKEEKQFG